MKDAIAVVLRRHRVEKGFSQEDLADIAGVHRTYVGMIERGEKNITIESLLRICVALDVRMSLIIREAESELEKRN